jgi:hypothetical protein
MAREGAHPPVGVVEREGHLLHHPVRMVRLVRRHLRPCKGFEQPVEVPAVDCPILKLTKCRALFPASLANACNLCDCSALQPASRATP